MSADDFILGNPVRDFKNLKTYQDAIQARDWQMCEHISENQELYFLIEENIELKNNLDFSETVRKSQASMIAKYRSIATCSYSHLFIFDGNGFCTKCGWSQMATIKK